MKTCLVSTHDGLKLLLNSFFLYPAGNVFPLFSHDHAQSSWHLFLSFSIPDGGVKMVQPGSEGLSRKASFSTLNIYSESVINAFIVNARNSFLL